MIIENFPRWLVADEVIKTHNHLKSLFKMSAKHFDKVNDEEMCIFISFPNNYLWNYTKTIIHLRLGDYRE
jgi:hypothetical protein